MPVKAEIFITLSFKAEVSVILLSVKKTLCKAILKFFLIEK